jgi:hypothetical protein
MLEIQNQKHFDEVVAHAKAVGLYEPADGEQTSDRRQYLKRALDRLEAFTRKNQEGAIVSRVLLYPDFAPHSFGFLLQTRARDGAWQASMVGGVIYHGAHDGNGSGAAPTLAVTLTPVTGWSIHT